MNAIDCYTTINGLSLLPVAVPRMPPSIAPSPLLAHFLRFSHLYAGREGKGSTYGKWRYNGKKSYGCFEVLYLQMTAE